MSEPVKLTEYIKSTKNQAIAGLEDWELKKPIELELSTTVQAKSGGELDIQIVQLGAKVQSEQIHRIKLSIGPKNEIEEMEKEAIKKSLQSNPTMAVAKYVKSFQ